MDVHDKKTRSYNMSCIKGKNTKPEEIVRKALFDNGFRYRKNDRRLPGTPDIVLPKYRTVIFVNKASQLKELGWQVITIWECELKKPVFDDTISTLIKTIKRNMPSIHGADGI